MMVSITGGNPGASNNEKIINVTSSQNVDINTSYTYYFYAAVNNISYDNMPGLGYLLYGNNFSGSISYY